MLLGQFLNYGISSNEGIVTYVYFPLLSLDYFIMKTKNLVVSLVGTILPILATANLTANAAELSTPVAQAGNTILAGFNTLVSVTDNYSGQNPFSGSNTLSQAGESATYSLSGSTNYGRQTTDYSGSASNSAQTGFGGDLRWSDTLTIVSDTLTPGTNVTIFFTLSMYSVLGYSFPVVNPGPRSESVFSVFANGIGQSLTHIYYGDGFNTQGSDFMTSTFGITTAVGSTIDLQGIYQPLVFVDGRLSSAGVAGSLSANTGLSISDVLPLVTGASANSFLFADDVPQASYISASGTNYSFTAGPSTAVPEPSSVIGLLGFGTIGGFAFHRRRSNKQTANS
jgi:PEP-CTERM motif